MGSCFRHGLAGVVEGGVGHPAIGGQPQQQGQGEQVAQERGKRPLAHLGEEGEQLHLGIRESGQGAGEVVEPDQIAGDQPGQVGGGQLGQQGEKSAPCQGGAGGQQAQGLSRMSQPRKEKSSLNSSHFQPRISSMLRRMARPAPSSGWSARR